MAREMFWVTCCFPIVSSTDVNLLDLENVVNGPNETQKAAYNDDDHLYRIAERRTTITACRLEV
jgi:hypothetical protein